MPFTFNEHVFPIDEGMFKERIRRQYLKRAFAWMSSKTDLDGLVKQKLAELNNHYQKFSDFFERMQGQGYCTIDYSVNNTLGESHTVTISGEKTDIFTLNGNAKNRQTAKREEEIMVPVEKQGDEFCLVLYHQPTAPLPGFGEIMLHYTFKTSFSLGKRYNGHAQWGIPPFTKDLLETNYGYNYDKQDYIGAWCGEPGKVIYRFRDALFQELRDAIFAPLLPFGKDKREHFTMEGTLSLLTGQAFYQGLMESTGTFPFFIRKDEDDDDDSEKMHVPFSPPTEALTETYALN